MTTEPILGSGGSQQHLDEKAEHATKPGRFDGLNRWWEGQPRYMQWLILLPVALLIFFLPVLNPPIITTEPGNDWPLACFDMARFALVALGLNVVVGQAGLLDLGYVGFFAVGSYVAALWTSPDSSYVHIPYLWTLPLAMLVTVAFGVCLGIPTLRLRGDYLAIVTLGFGEIIRLLATIIPAMRGQQGFKEVGHPPGPSDHGVPLFANNHGTPWYMLTVAIIVVVMILLGNIERSRVGRAWIAIREDEDAAEIMGVPTFKFKIWAFGTGAAIGGLSGALFAGQVGFVNNQKFDVVTSVLFLSAVILGGSGNKVGVIIGGALVSYIPNRFTAIADYKYLIFGVALVLLMIFRSQGLIGARSHLLAYGRRARERTATLVAHGVKSGALSPDPSYSSPVTGPVTGDPGTPDLPYYGISFFGAFKRAFQKWAHFRGRASRSEYWWFSLAQLIIIGILWIPLSYVSSAPNTPAVLAVTILILVCVLATIIPGISLAVRRLHDTGRSGWTYLLTLIPIADFVLLVLLAEASKPEGKRYDPTRPAGANGPRETDAVKEASS